MAKIDTKELHALEARLIECGIEPRLVHDDRRERIATAAMQGILAYGREERETQKVAEAAVRMADALIAELDKAAGGEA